MTRAFVGCCSALALVGVACICMDPSFVGPHVATANAGARPGDEPDVHQFPQGAVSGLEENSAVRGAPSFGSIGTFMVGVVLGALLLVTSPRAAFAEVEDQQIPVDGKGKTMTFSKEQLVRAKRLYNNTCAICHVGGGTRTNQNVGLSYEELEGAVPARTNINALVAFLNNPTTYDGLYDISETHPSIKSADLFPKMRSMKQQDLYDMSAYVLYNCQTIPEKWGGGKQYY